MAANSFEFEKLLSSIDRLDDSQRRTLLDRLSQGIASQHNDTRDSRTLLDAFDEFGMSGSIRNAPDDLSCHPQHMNGFGDDVS